jgi:hypothetical protein
MILLFPFGLTPDQIAWWGFIATVAAALCAIWGGVASTLAAKYAKDAPTKADMKRVEEHMAATSQHLHRQARREEFSAKANQVSISVRGMNPIDEPLIATIVVRDPTVRLTRVDLLNEPGESGTVYGTSETFQMDAKTYNAGIGSGDLQRLLQSGVQSRNAGIRLYMVIERVEVNRDVPVLLARVQIPTDKQGQYGTWWSIQGEV